MSARTISAPLSAKPSLEARFAEILALLDTLRGVRLDLEILDVIPGRASLFFELKMKERNALFLLAAARAGLIAELNQLEGA